MPESPNLADLRHRASCSKFDGLAHTLLLATHVAELSFASCSSQVHMSDASEAMLNNVHQRISSHYGSVESSSANLLSTTQPHTLSVEQVVSALRTDIKLGLSLSQHVQRLATFGANTNYSPELSFWHVIRSEITEPLIMMLLAVGLLYCVWGQIQEALTAISVIAVTILMEVYIELKAKRALNHMIKQDCVRDICVTRSAKRIFAASDTLTIGDIVSVVVGDKIPADGRLVSSESISVNQSVLTGESADVLKDKESICESNTQVANRKNMLFKGTLVTHGLGVIVVTSIGDKTEFGKIHKEAAQLKQPKTALQKSIKHLTKVLTMAAAVSVLLVALSCWSHGFNYQQIVLASLSLSFVVIPEELPILLKILQGISAQRLGKSGIIVKSLKAIESLGAVTVVLSDKTGTITTNKLRLHSFALPSSNIMHQVERMSWSADNNSLLEAWLHSSPDTSVCHIDTVRDQFDRAVLMCISSNQSVRLAYQAACKLIEQNNVKAIMTFSFDNWRCRSSRLLDYNPSDQTKPDYRLYTRGSVTAVLMQCTHYNAPDNNVQMLTPIIVASIISQADCMASNGMRTLAFAIRSIKGDQVLQTDADRLENDMTFVGIFAFVDSVKSDAASTVDQLHQAGIKVKIISGDNAASVRSVARACGILASPRNLSSDTNDIHMMNDVYDKKPFTADQHLTVEFQTYSHLTPDDKFELVLCHQRAGGIVMMLGDGINDGLSLKAADVGVAMGEHGTDLARQCAGVVLTQDNFSSIVIAVLEGRRMLDNLWSSILFYLACKLAIALLFGSALLYSGNLPLRPMQAIVLESLMDFGSGACFVMEPGRRNLLNKPTSEYANGGLGHVSSPLLYRLACPVVMYGTVLWFFVNLSYMIGMNVDLATAQSMVWLTWLVGHVLLANSMRKEPILRPSNLLINKVMSVWAISMIVFALVTTCQPQLRQVLLLSDLSQSNQVFQVTFPLWIWATAPAIAAFSIYQCIKVFIASNAEL